MNIYYSFCSIFRPKGALLLPRKEITNDKNENLLLLSLYFETKRSTPFAQYYDQKEYSFYPERSSQMTKMKIYYSFHSILRQKGVLLLLNILTKRSTPFTQKGVPKMTKMNIYYSFCSIFRPKGVPKMTKMNI